MASQELLTVIKQIEKLHPQWDGKTRGFDQGKITFEADDGTKVFMYTGFSMSTNRPQTRRSFIHIEHIVQDKRPPVEIYYKEWREEVLAGNMHSPDKVLLDVGSCNYLANYIMKILEKSRNRERMRATPKHKASKINSGNVD